MAALVRLAVLRRQPPRTHSPPPPTHRPAPGGWPGRSEGSAAPGAATTAGVDPRGERGSVSVEAAFVMCALVAVLAIVLGGVCAVVAQVRCVDAAREAARLVARGESGRADEVARRLAPGGASVAVRIAGDEVTVEVSAEPVGGGLAGLTVRAKAMAILEPGVVGTP